MIRIKLIRSPHVNVSAPPNVPTITSLTNIYSDQLTVTWIFVPMATSYMYNVSAALPDLSEGLQHAGSQGCLYNLKNVYKAKCLYNWFVQLHNYSMQTFTHIWCCVATNDQPRCKRGLLVSRENLGKEGQQTYSCLLSYENYKSKMNAFKLMNGYDRNANAGQHIKGVVCLKMIYRSPYLDAVRF